VISAQKITARVCCDVDCGCSNAETAVGNVTVIAIKFTIRPMKLFLANDTEVPFMKLYT
jgi:hypothetical protein